MSTETFTAQDRRFMDVALSLAFSGLGKTAPNPSVGCVIVKKGRIVGSGVTAPGGRPHAEPQALEQAGEMARGATAYVTLEPCAHHGVTPPCAEALVKAGVARVVIACVDPFHKVDGRGIDILNSASITVSTGLREADALALNAGFFCLLREGIPLLEADKRPGLYDGDLALADGESLDQALKDAAAQGLTRLRRA